MTSAELNKLADDMAETVNRLIESANSEPRLIAGNLTELAGYVRGLAAALRARATIADAAGGGE